MNGDFLAIVFAVSLPYMHVSLHFPVNPGVAQVEMLVLGVDVEIA